MKYVSFTTASGQQGFGRLDGDVITDLSAQAADLKTAITEGTLSSLNSETTLSLADVTLGPVVPNPDKVFCVGHNYETHRQETGRAATDHPSIFVRFADSLSGHNQPIVMPKVFFHTCVKQSKMKNCCKMHHYVSSKPIQNEGDSNSEMVD